MGDTRKDLPPGEWLRPLASLRVVEIGFRAIYPSGITLRQPMGAALRSLFGAKLFAAEGGASPGDPFGGWETSGPGIRLFRHGGGEGGSRDVARWWLRMEAAARRLPPGGNLDASLCIADPSDEDVEVAVAAFGGALRELTRAESWIQDPWIRDVSFCPLAGCTAWRISLDTPTDFGGSLERSRQECPDAPALAALLRAGTRRCAGLMNLVVTPAERGHVVLPSLRDVELLGGALRPWEDARVRSGGERIPLHGWLGHLLVRGSVLAELSPLIEAMACFHLGKGVTSGLGRVSVVPLDAPGADAREEEAASGAGVR